MNFTMFNKGNLERKFTYFGEDNAPCMLINNHASKTSAFIPLKAGYKYNEPEARDQAGLIEGFDLLRKIDQNQMLSANPDAVVMGLMQIGYEDLLFGIALDIFRMAISLGISLDNSSLLRLREYVADGLDDLIKMKPFRKGTNDVLLQNSKQKIEYDLEIDGTKISGEYEG